MTEETVRMGEGTRTGATSRRMLAARIGMVLGALMLVAAFFLPWGTADGEWRDAAAATPDAMFYEPTGMTVADAADISLLEYAQVYASMDGAWAVYTAIMYTTAGVSVLALILAALGKPWGASLFALVAVAGSRLLAWDFQDRGVLPGTTHDWGGRTRRLHRRGRHPARRGDMDDRHEKEGEGGPGRPRLRKGLTIGSRQAMAVGSITKEVASC